jgi:UDP-N-acetylglucosamine 2-epimerase
MVALNMKLCIVAGARPNFMKIAPIVDAINSHNRSNHRPIDYFIVHTGQHYDQEMSKLFFQDLGIPNPDINLEVGSASHAVQTGGIQEETTILGIPCVTIRENTERPITVTHETNVIAGAKKANIINAAYYGQLKKFSGACGVNTPPLWDGKAAERIVEILAKE